MTAVPKMNVIRDKAYRQWADRSPCEVCGVTTSHDVVLAHIRIAGNCGTGMKPSDDESLFLCHRDHTEYDQSPDRNVWLVMNILCPGVEEAPSADAADYMVRYLLIPQRKAAYRRWKAER